MKPEIRVQLANALEYECDVLVLKYAQSFYGLDAAVALALGDGAEPRGIAPEPGRFTLVPTLGRIAASEALFVGVVDLYSFDYARIREFSARALQLLASQRPHVVEIAMTVHGVGYGLDERETFLSQLAGIADAMLDARLPPALQRITIVERSPQRAARLAKLLALATPTPSPSPEASPELPRLLDAGAASARKPHVFVAMPFDERMEDVYTFGIQEPIHAAGYLCERIDMATFSGDILRRILERIDTAEIVVADLSGSNANVYLEVGYAWGRNRKTILLVNQVEELKFDIRGQRCIVYKNITDLRRKLQAELESLQ